MSGNQTSAVVVLAIVGALGGVLWWRRRNQPSDKTSGNGSSFRFPKPAPSSSLPRLDVLGDAGDNASLTQPLGRHMTAEPYVKAGRNKAAKSANKKKRPKEDKKAEKERRDEKRVK